MQKHYCLCVQVLVNAALYPPCHGDLFYSLKEKGILDELIKDVKNICLLAYDNLAATVDFKILEYVINNDIDFLMEVTDKTRADIKGGTIIEYENALRL